MPNPVGSPVQPCPKEDEKDTQEPQQQEPHWIKFQVKDDTGKSMAGVKLHVVLPDGAREEKTSDVNGMIEITNVKPGNCSIDMDYDDHVVHQTVFIQ